MPGKDRVRMRSPREADPTLAVHGYAKRRANLQVPGNIVALRRQLSAAEVVANFVGAYLEVEWAFSAWMDRQLVERKFLDKTTRLAVARKPRGPDLDRQTAGIRGTPFAARICEQIPQPPRASPRGQAQPNKPDFVPASSRKRGIDFVQSLHWGGQAARESHAAELISKSSRASFPTAASTSGVSAATKSNRAASMPKIMSREGRRSSARASSIVSRISKACVEHSNACFGRTASFAFHTRMHPGWPEGAVASTTIKSSESEKMSIRFKPSPECSNNFMPRLSAPRARSRRTASSPAPSSPRSRLPQPTMRSAITPPFPDEA